MHARVVVIPFNDRGIRLTISKRCLCERLGLRKRRIRSVLITATTFDRDILSFRVLRCGRMKGISFALVIDCSIFMVSLYTSSSSGSRHVAYDVQHLVPHLSIAPFDSVFSSHLESFQIHLLLQALKQQQSLHSFQCTKLLSNSITSIISVNIPFLATRLRIVAAGARLRGCDRGCVQEFMHRCGDVRRDHSGLSHPARQVGFERVLVCIARSLRFAGPFVHPERSLELQVV